MSLESLANAKPYMKDIVELYLKVVEFEKAELSGDYSRVSDERNCYVGQDVDTVVREFERIFDAGEEELAALGDTLRSGEVDFMRLPQQEAEAPGDDRGTEIPSFLYIISRPYFRSLSKTLAVDNIRWEEGRCPLCNAAPSISILEKNELRKYHCSFCGTTGHFKRIGCAYCDTDRAGDIEIMFSEEIEGVRVDACKKCKTYIKSVNAESLFRHSARELDLISLPLDIVAQRKGFIRRSPNPVGITSFR